MSVKKMSYRSSFSLYSTHLSSLLENIYKKAYCYAVGLFFVYLHHYLISKRQSK